MATIQDFEKLDIRVGKIIEVRDFPKARKLLYKLKIDFEPEIGIKNSAAGLKPAHTKQELLGKLILGVVNFPPRKIADFMSEALTLGVPSQDGGWMLIIPAFPEKTNLGDKLA